MQFGFAPCAQAARRQRNNVRELLGKGAEREKEHEILPISRARKGDNIGIRCEDLGARPHVGRSSDSAGRVSATNSIPSRLIRSLLLRAAHPRISEDTHVLKISDEARAGGKKIATHDHSTRLGHQSIELSANFSKCRIERVSVLGTRHLRKFA